MPRLLTGNPSYRLHNPSRQAVVTLNGEDIHVGFKKPSQVVGGEPIVW